MYGGEAFAVAALLTHKACIGWFICQLVVEVFTADAAEIFEQTVYTGDDVTNDILLYFAGVSFRIETEVYTSFLQVGKFKFVCFFPDICAHSTYGVAFDDCGDVRVCVSSIIFCRMALLAVSFI